MYISESKIPLYFVDNKTIEISGTNKDRNNIFKALIHNYNRGIFRIKIKQKNQKRFELNEEDDIFNIKNNGIKISIGDKTIVIHYFSKKNKI